MTKMTRALRLITLGTSLVLAPAFSGSAFATTTPGSLTLSSTFDAISVRASFSGDPNGNNSATLQFRLQGSSTWKNAFRPIVDRRATIAGHTNPYVNQARGSIVGLVAGMTYEVSLTFADPDGVVGSATLTGTVSTIAPVAPVSGREWFVDDVPTNGNGSSASPFNSIPNALNAAAAGDTIHVRPGTYPAFTVNKSGTATAFVAIVGDARDQVFISGSGGNNINVAANYVQLKNLRLKQSTHSSIEIQNSIHHVWMENIYHENISSSRTYGDAGILIDNNTHHVYVLSNEFYSQSLTDFNIPGFAWDQAGAGIYINDSPNSQGTFVFKNNIFAAGFRDCIGNSTESWGNGTIDNSDIAYNVISLCKDDGIQMEGDDVNLRIFGNYVDAAVGWSALAMAPHLVGPVYVFRNVLRLHSPNAGCGVKSEDSPGFAFYINNTMDTTGGGGSDGWCLGASGSRPYDFLYNNIIRTAGIGVDGSSSTGALDYNLYLSGGTYIADWNGSSNYSSISSFRTATSQEAHGLQANPNFLDAQKHIDSTSPAYNAGVVIANFNDAGSAWPYVGSAPDIGAYEVGGGSAPPPAPAPPQNLRIIP